MNVKRIVIIGGGASGILAAIIAKRNGADVTILEKNNRIGKKILATGNGRCNYTNIHTTKDAYNHPDFVQSTLEQFSAADAIAFFESLGIAPKVEDFGKTYPLSEQASSIIDVFLYELEHLKINVKTDSQVNQIERKDQKFVIRTVSGEVYEADHVILSTGGKAMPSTGSDGLGYPLARKFGHQVTTIFPALVRLKLDSPYLKQLDGVKISSTVCLNYGQETLQKEKGDILFTSYGISGPTILDLSRKANELLNQKINPVVDVMLLDQLTRSAIETRFNQSLDKPVDFSLIGLVNKRLISALIKEAGIQKQNTLVRDLSKSELNRLISLLFHWEFKVIGSKGFEDAQVTAGGVDINEVNPETLESKLVKGLYFTGEVLDIDGLCGGYNLQWAWSSAFVAGNHASRTT